MSQFRIILQDLTVTRDPL